MAKSRAPKGGDTPGGADRRSFQILGEQYFLSEKPLSDDSTEGLVYEARYRDLLRCAVKIIKSDVVDVDALQTEVALLALLRHTNIVKILSWGNAQMEGADSKGTKTISGLGPVQPVIVTDLVDGGRLESAWNNVRGPDDVLEVLRQLFDAVAYLHARGVLHTDLKPKNIMFEPETNRVVVIDLGFSVLAEEERFRKYFPGLKEQPLLERQVVYIACAEKYTTPARWALLKQSHSVEREVVRKEWFPGHDLYALGVILEDALDHPEVANSLSRDWRLASGLRYIADRLKKESYPTGAEGALKDVVKLQAAHIAPMGVEELGALPTSGTSLVLSSTQMPLSQRMQRVLHHRIVQRLRDISQLDFVSLLYPDARHSRIAHSSLAMDLMSRALVQLLRDPLFRVSVDKEDIEAALLYSFLHDVGHYPLLHMFEDFRGESTPGGKILLDDDLFLPFLSLGERGVGATKSVKEMLKNLRKSEQLTPLENTIVEHFGSATRDALLSVAMCAIEGKRPRKAVHRLLAGLANSAVDLDKVAYLTADSHMSGVPYGAGIDLHGYLTSLRMPKKPLADADAATPLIGVEERGLAAAESVIFARYWMLHRVYWQHTNRAIMAAFKFAIRYLIDQGGLNFPQYLRTSLWWSELEAARYLRDEVERISKDSGTSEEFINPLTGLLEGNRTVYRRLVVASVGKDPTFYNALTSLHGPEVIQDALQDFVDERRIDVKIKPGMVLVDIPNRARDLLHLERIWIVTEEDSRVVEEVSLAESGTKTALQELIAAWPTPEEQAGGTKTIVAHGVASEFLNEVKKSRVYIHPALSYMLSSKELVEEAREFVRERVVHHAGS